ncbi:cytidylyltransferase family-domain-containing protein [Mucor lusitanicus]
MASLVLGLLLFGNDKSTFVLMTLIQAKVFHELRRIGLTIDNVHSGKIQIYSDCSILGQRIAHQSWIHLSILYTLTQPAFIHWNIANGGLFWFIFPCFLVICNDCSAYYCGNRWGRTKLINLSPSKTVEGFVGALCITVLFGYIASDVLCRFDSLLADNNLEIYDNIRYHGVIMALYASIFAPFGGFLASALKRSTNIKDFAGWIPGHGGIVDRVDCQLFMAIFTYLYYQRIVNA